MPTWSMTFSDADFTSIDVINMLFEALWEREFATNVSDWTVAPATTVAAGKDVQEAAFWANLQERVEALFPAADGLAGSFFVTSAFTPAGVAYTGSGSADHPAVTAGAAITLGYMRDTLGWDGWMRKRPREISSTAAAFDEAGNPATTGQVAALLGSGAAWHLSTTVYEWSGTAWVGTTADRADVILTDRAKFRRVSLTTQISDDDGNVAFPGHLALLVLSGSDTGADGRIYTFDGTVWQPTPDAAPDLLVGEAGVLREIAGLSATEDQFGHPAAPGQRAVYLGDVYIYVDGIGWETDEEDPFAPADRLPSSGDGILLGRMQRGDVIGVWILTEIRDLIDFTGNKTSSAVETDPYINSGTGVSDFWYTPDDPDTITDSWVKAHASFDLDWPQSVSGTAGTSYVSKRHVLTNYDGAHPPYFFDSPYLHSARAYKVPHRYRVNANDHRTRSANVYIGYVGPTHSVAPIDVYNTQGLGTVTEDTFAILSAATFSSGKYSGWVQLFTDITTEPPNWPAELVPPDPVPVGVWVESEIKGLGLQYPVAIVTWTFDWD